eukprot:CCRYP_017303-RA/>CCRYP_017303-RA protein AED:0.21 eAED:0.21 QI:0/-1/0/1/-1/1/1/0/275
MALTMIALGSLTERTQEDNSDASSHSSCEDESHMDIMTMPMKDDSPPSALGGHGRLSSRRASWKFNTDWESAISSFRSGSTSMLSSSLNSWYHVLDIEDGDVDADNQEGVTQETAGEDGGHVPSSITAREKSFKRSVHTTLLCDDERTSFQSSLGSDHFMGNDIHCYPESWDTSDQVKSHENDQVKSSTSPREQQRESVIHVAQPPARRSADNTVVTLKSRLSELIEMNDDIACQGLTQFVPLEKHDVELLQERVKSLEDLDEELNQDKKKARAA